MTTAAVPKSPLARWHQLVDANHGTARGLVRTALGQLEFMAGRLDAHLQPVAPQVQRLVFVCLGNINRSAFAEQVARARGARTCSIGLSTTTGAPAFHKAVQHAPHFGLDLAQHRATDMRDYQPEAGDLLLAMEVRHVRRLVAAGIAPSSIALLGHWAAPHRIHLHDPHTLSDAYFRTCFALLHSAVNGLIEQLRVADSPCLLP